MNDVTKRMIEGDRALVDLLLQIDSAQAALDGSGRGAFSSNAEE